MEESKFAAPMVSPEVLKQLGLCGGKQGMAGLATPNLDAYRDAAERIIQQQEAERLEQVAKEMEGVPVRTQKLNRKQRRAAAKKAIQDKKKKQSSDAEPQTQYVCDPTKNIHCKKNHCHLNGGPCQHTTNLEYAKQPVEKARMVIPVSGKERTELMKQYAEELKSI